MIKSSFVMVACISASSAWSSFSLQAQTPPPNAVPTPGGVAAPNGFENTTVLRASQLLQPMYLTGPLFRVREQVASEWGINSYAIDTTHYGTLAALGNNQLLERIAEISAMKRLDQLMKTDAYHDALEDAADAVTEGEEDSADGIRMPRKDSLEEQPSTAIGKYFHRLGKDVEKEIKGAKYRDYYDYLSQSTDGVAKAKRELCRKLRLNPYSTNTLLQAKLDGMSRALALGGFKFVVGDGCEDPAAEAAIVASQGNLATLLGPMVYEKDATELRKANGNALKLLGISPADSAGFLISIVYTPWQQTQAVLALQKLNGVVGVGLFLRDAATASSSESDAVFYTETAKLLAQFQAAQWQIARIELNQNIPFCILADGSVLLALHWDYAGWTPTADKCANWLQALTVDGKKPGKVTIAITGAASPRFRQEMEKRGFQLLDRQDKGPLN